MANWLTLIIVLHVLIALAIKLDSKAIDDWLSISCS